MKTVDGYLSKQIQEVWPDAIVYMTPAGLAQGLLYIVERPGAEPIALGIGFKDAKASVQALRRQKVAVIRARPKD